jgi:hypothetical protein
MVVVLVEEMNAGARSAKALFACEWVTGVFIKYILAELEGYFPPPLHILRLSRLVRQAQPKAFTTASPICTVLTLVVPSE